TISEDLQVWCGERLVILLCFGLLPVNNVEFFVVGFGYFGQAEIASYMKGKLCLWEPPHEPFFNINFDGAYDPQHARSGSMVVVRNPVGEILASMAVGHKVISFSLAAKAEACVQVLQLGIHMGAECAIIEGDSLTTIKKANSDSEDKSEIRAITKNIQQYKENFQQIIFRHISRSANSLTHHLAKESLKKGEDNNLSGESQISYAGQKREEDNEPQIE
ncbi:hypothetical protein Goari_016265, partial [Gossypium aridum]|nr:hypothetical protein [Gossypium aridum]